MATIKTLLGNVKGKDGRGYEEVTLYDGDCSACINWNVISADSPMMELSDSIENYKSIRIEFTSFNGIGTGGEEEGVVTTSTTYSVNYIKTTYIHSGLECSTGSGNSYYSRQAFGFYDNKHLVLTWEEYSGWEHNISHITVTGIRDRVSDAEKNFNKYSTTEEVVGTWISGETIYRKVISCGTLPNKTDKTVAHGISNFNHIIQVSGFCKDASQSYPLPFPNDRNSTGVGSVGIWVDKTNITISCLGTYYPSVIETYVILEYTKTT